MTTTGFVGPKMAMVDLSFHTPFGRLEFGRIYEFGKADVP